MTLPLELGGVHDPTVRRALEQLSQQFPIVIPAGGGGGGGAPSGPAGGVLGGTYPSPAFAVDMATQAELDAHHANHEPGGIDAMTVDAAAATGSLRTLGTTATSAAAGNDARLSDARTPSGVIAGDLAGSTWPTLNIAAGVIVNADINAAAAIAETKLNLATDAAAGTGSRRTLGPGALQAAPGNDARLTDARTPTAHATTHQPGGTDAMAVDAAAGTGSLRTIGTGALQAAAGNDARLSDARTPTAHQTTHQSGNADALTGNLDATARSNISKAGTLIGARRGLNLIQGTNVTLTMTDDAPNERVNVTVDAAAGGGGTADTFATRLRWMTD